MFLAMRTALSLLSILGTSRAGYQSPDLRPQFRYSKRFTYRIIHASGERFFDLLHARVGTDGENR
jgi:hypothetical protein